MISPSVALSLWLAVWGLSPSYPQTPKQKENDQQKPSAYQDVSRNAVVSEDKVHSNSGSQQDKQQESCWHETINWLDEHDGAITAVSTFVVAAFTIALFIATKRLWQSGEKHSERELRAYVFVTRGNVEDFRVHEHPKATILIKNAGQTPATEFNVIATFDLHAFPRTEFAPYRDTGHYKSRGTLGPGIKVEIIRTMPTPLNAQQRGNIIRGEAGIFVFGQVNYRDAFGNDRFTRFRVAFVGNGTDPGDVLPLIPTEEGNEAT